MTIPKKNIVISVVSVILVIGIAIGLVFEIQHFHRRNDVGNRVQLTARNNAVVALCKKTDDQKLCHDTLDNVNSTHPQDYIKAAVQATIYNVIKSLNISDMLVLQATHNPRTKMAIEDCKYLLQFALRDLQAIILAEGGRVDLQTLQDLSYDFKVWLSAVISYQQTCIDGFGEDVKIDQKIFKDMQNGGLLDAGKTTSLALAVVDEVSKILKSFGFGIKPKPTPRRLLGYPTWFSATDRKILATDVNEGVTPNAVVAKDGSGQFKNVTAALAAIPNNYTDRYVIYVKAGVYNEYISVKSPYVTMYGDGPDKTIVTGNKSNKKGWSTLETATFVVEVDGFIGKDMGFQNTAGPDEGQAVALRVQGDMSAFFNCNIDGYQDTLWVQAKRQFYRDCNISGTIDFIFGDSFALIQNSKIIVKRPADGQSNLITAQGRTDPHEPTAIVIHKCKIVAEDDLINDKVKFKSYMGRPWKPLATTIVMESNLGSFLEPQGWAPWNATTPPADTLFFAEYANTGPGADVTARVNWKGFNVIDKQSVLRFSPAFFLERSSIWLKKTGIPVHYEL